MRRDNDSYESNVKLSPLRHRKGLVFRTVRETDPEHGSSPNCYYLALRPF